MDSAQPDLRESPLTPINKKMCERDLISALPDHILAHVLSFMLMRDAVATSLLSRRWRNLWKSVPTLNFDDMNRYGVEKKLNWEPFRDWVNGVLGQLDDLRNIQEFCISSDFDDEMDRYLGGWISFALHRNVRALHLSMPSYYDDESDTPFWNSTFPSMFEHTASSVTELELLGFYVDSPRFGSFKSLTSLSLVDVHVTDAVIESFLSSCPLLEHLHIGSGTGLVNMKVVGSSLRLRHLELYYCNSVKRIEIDAQNLVVFKCEMPMRGSLVIRLRSVPKLVDVSLGFFDYNMVMSHAFNQLSTVAAQVETLSLNTRAMKVGAVTLAKCPKFDCLKVLVLSVYRLKGLAWFLKACPSLQKLVMDIGVKGKNTLQLNDSDFRHQHLKEIQLHGFEGQSCEMKLALCLVKAAAALEKLQIHVCKHAVSEQRIQYRRDHAMELRMALPPRAQLVVN